MVVKVSNSPMSPRRARKGEHNYPMFDRYSIVHGVVGGMMGLYGVSKGTAFLTSIAWEAAEPSLKAKAPSLFPRSTYDTAQNKVGDTISLMAGWWLARKK